MSRVLFAHQSRRSLRKTVRIACLATVAFFVSISALAQAVGVPFRHGVKVEINGKGPFLFGIDTGSSIAFSINPRLAEEIGLPVVSHTHLHTGGEKSSSDAPQVDVVRIDTMLIGGASLTHLIGITTETQAVGTLGVDAFKNTTVTLDYKSDSLSLSPEKLAQADQQTIFKYTSDRTTPVIPITLAGMATSAHLDTGAREVGSDLMIPLELAKTLPLKSPIHQKGTVEDALGRSFQRYTSVLDGDLRIGSITVHQPTLLISDRTPYVNLASLCNRLLIRLDIGDNLIQLKMADTSNQE
jgi:predicted aspartyl protease